MKAAIRADGGKDIGMGHIMRCMVLANAFSENVELSFIIKEDSSVVKLLEEKGFEIITIDYNLDYQAEIRRVKEIIIKKEIEILITDSYELDQNYLTELKKEVAKLVSIHDFAPFAFPSDIVINGNIYAPKRDYQSLTGKTEFLLGTDYTLLRNEFTNISKTVLDNEGVKRILVTFGGGDPLNLTPQILGSLNKIEDKLIANNIKIDVVVGPAFNNLAEIVEKVKESNLEVTLHFNIKQMSKLMLDSDLAISAGGSTLYELTATGTPAIVLLQAENQVLAAEAMAEEGLIINLGFWDESKEEKLIDNLTNLINNLNLRYKMSKKGQEIVDGKGAERCAEEIISVCVSDSCL
ncbi:UDP-2,4-diacetamido-2,4,6-trideoxy-beta-L-altropyranose hydrolase [Natroniella sp. ANB-PHB2]|uniref:UDP-2,4-diacetamido-2,4, 6-trideoxy-beta-L-altropyranose hydrolase n=1 Tax=Natroniella sp. ANB-PHB2 TaxID=3384444 RepID=UPI0038D3DB23